VLELAFLVRPSPFPPEALAGVLEPVLSGRVAVRDASSFPSPMGAAGRQDPRERSTRIQLN